MSDFLDRLAARRRFGMRPSLDAISGVCAALGDPQKKLRAIHVAGTNGKGAVCAIIDACLRSGGLRACRDTSPHLVRINDGLLVSTPLALRGGAGGETKKQIVLLFRLRVKR